MQWCAIHAHITLGLLIKIITINSSSILELNTFIHDLIRDKQKKEKKKKNRRTYRLGLFKKITRLQLRSLPPPAAGVLNAEAAAATIAVKTNIHQSTLKMVIDVMARSFFLLELKENLQNMTMKKLPWLWERPSKRLPNKKSFWRTKESSKTELQHCPRWKKKNLKNKIWTKRPLTRSITLKLIRVNNLIQGLTTSETPKPTRINRESNLEVTMTKKTRKSA